MSGCTTVSRQTIAYNAREQKFAFLGDAHIFIYNARGAYRLETIIPFCEKIQTVQDGTEQHIASGGIFTSIVGTNTAGIIAAGIENMNQ